MANAVDEGSLKQ